MALSTLEQLQLLMNPYYQGSGQEEFLSEVLETYPVPECAAAYLWGIKAGELAGDAGNISSISNGSESTSYAIGEAYRNAQSQRDYYRKECELKTSGGTGATGAVVRGEKENIAGIPAYLC